MADHDRAAQNTVLPVEQVGDLLIVTPVGDPIGFSPAVFRKEFSRVKQLAAKPSVRNVLVDFSNADYFGSAMIGSLVELRRAVANSHGQVVNDDESMTASAADGGVTAICGVSDDMLKGLEILSVDDVLVKYPTRKKAVRELANQSLASRFQTAKLPTKILTPLTVAAAACLLMFTPVASGMFNGTASGDFDTLTRIYSRWDLRSTASLTPEDTKRISEPLLLELRSIRSRIRSQKPTSEARIYVAVAAGRLSEVMNSPKDLDRAKEFYQMLTTARQKIFDETGLVASVPDSLAGFVPRPQVEADGAVKSEGNESAGANK